MKCDCWCVFPLWQVNYMRECYREVVRRFMKQTDPKPTWQTMVTALRDISEFTLAKYIRSTFTFGAYGFIHV